jgi:antitoxin ParD1/3/4
MAASLPGDKWCAAVYDYYAKNRGHEKRPSGSDKRDRHRRLFPLRCNESLDVGGPKVIQIQLPPGLQVFVQDLIDTGRYPSPEEVIHDALWLLKDQADLRALKLAELRKQIAIGIEQADRGEVAPLDMNAVLAEAMRLLQQEREKQQEVVGCPK